MPTSTLSLYIGAIIISFVPACVRWANLPAGDVAFYRFFFGGIFLWALNPKALLLRPKGLLFGVLAILFLSLDMNLWHRSILIVGTGLACLLANTQVFYLSIYSLINKDQKLNISLFFSIFSAFIGLGLMYFPKEILIVENLALWQMGILFGCLAGLAYSIFIICFRRFQEVSQLSPLPCLTIITIGCAMVCGLATFGQGLTSMFDFDLYQWCALIALGVGVHAGGWLCISHGMKKASYSQIGLALLIQPALALIWAHLFFGEVWDQHSMLGMFLVLSALIIDTANRLYGRYKLK